MKILHILNDGETEPAKKIIDFQSKEHDVNVIDLSQGNASYELIVDEIFANDSVISW
jgi:hypothetical protein